MSEYRRFNGSIPEQWDDDAEEMGVQTAEYVRRMVRLGRLQWGHDHVEEPENPHLILQEPVTLPEEVEAVVLELVKRNLAGSDGVSEEQLVEFIVGDFQELVNDQLEKLQEEGLVTYSPSQGGWVMEK